MTAKEAIETLRANYPDACYEQLREAVDAAIEALKARDTAGDTISRQAAIDAVLDRMNVEKHGRNAKPEEIQWTLEKLPSAQPFHNTTMNEVLKYIDDMPEDVWQEFTACLECRGWELQRRTAKWCGGDFV